MRITVQITIFYNSHGQEVIEGSWLQAIENDCFVCTSFDQQTGQKKAQVVVPLSSIKKVKIELLPEVAA